MWRRRRRREKSSTYGEKLISLWHTDLRVALQAHLTLPKHPFISSKPPFVSQHPIISAELATPEPMMGPIKEERVGISWKQQGWVWVLGGKWKLREEHQEMWHTSACGNCFCISPWRNFLSRKKKCKNKMRTFSGQINSHLRGKYGTVYITVCITV